MTGFLDTSMVVRYLVRDVAEIAKQAAGDLWIIGAVLAEAGYVMRSVYLLQREIIIDHLMALPSRRNIDCHGLDKGLVLQGLLMCRLSGRISVADAMIWAAARSSGHNVVYTFDVRFPSDGITVRTGL